MKNRELGVIEKIRIYAAKGDKGKELAKAYLIENLGLEGDFYATKTANTKGSDRQITLMFAENRSGSSDAASENGLCIRRFKENITIKECNAPLLSPGTQLAINEAILEISAETKHCHEECPLFRDGKRCSLAGLNLFARVLKGGMIRPGDKVEITNQNLP